MSDRPLSASQMSPSQLREWKLEQRIADLEGENGALTKRMLALEAALGDLVRATADTTESIGTWQRAYEVWLNEAGEGSEE